MGCLQEDREPSARLQRLVGVDISASALARGSKRLAALVDPESDAPELSEPQPSSLAASIFGPGQLSGGASMQACFGDLAAGDPLLVLPDLPNAASYLGNGQDSRNRHAAIGRRTATANGHAAEDKLGPQPGANAELPAVMESIWSSAVPPADAALHGGLPAIDMLVGDICCQELASLGELRIP